MQGKTASRKQIDQVITKMIRKSSKAPAGFHKRIRRVAEDTATELKVKGRKFKIPWLLLLIFIPVLIVVYLIIIKRLEGEGGYVPGDSPDEPIDLKGRDTQGLLKDFDYKKRG